MDKEEYLRIKQTTQKELDSLNNKIANCDIELGDDSSFEYEDEQYVPRNREEILYVEHMEAVANLRNQLRIEKKEKEIQLAENDIKYNREKRKSRYIEELSKYTRGKVVNEIDEAKLLDEDVFGRQEYAQQIANCLCNSDLKSPFNIAIFGKWGVGKTVFAKRIKEDIRKNDPKKKIKIVDFNAAEYSSKIMVNKDDHIEQQWGNLLTELLIMFEKEHKFIAPIKFAWAKIRRNKYVYIRYSLFTFFLAIISYLIGLLKNNWANWLSEIGQASFVVAAVIPVLKNIISTIRPLVEEVKHKSHLMPNYNDILGSRKRTAEDLKILIDAWIHKEDSKIVVFVDDCDRCSLEGTMELMEAMHLFLEVDRLFFVFLIDGSVLSKTVAQYYEKEESVYLLESFLDKYIARTITLDNPESKDYIIHLKGRIESNDADKCCIKEDEYEAFISYISDQKSVTPRMILRLINSVVALKDTFINKETVYQELDFAELMAWFLFRYFYTDIYGVLKKSFNPSIGYIAAGSIAIKNEGINRDYLDSAIWSAISEIPVEALITVEKEMGMMISQCFEKSDISA